MFFCDECDYSCEAELAEDLVIMNRFNVAVVCVCVVIGMSLFCVGLFVLFREPQPERGVGIYCPACGVTSLEYNETVIWENSWQCPACGHVNIWHTSPTPIPSNMAYQIICRNCSSELFYHPGGFVVSPIELLKCNVCGFLGYPSDYDVSYRVQQSSYYFNGKVGLHCKTCFSDEQYWLSESQYQCIDCGVKTFVNVAK
ncbi:MAG: hypothetical protein LBB87_01270 [Nitrososphaerota archaeon]|jgi:hypothetical protein|nr:hypothetical protein [Nitrososphaerota archaeon]